MPKSAFKDAMVGRRCCVAGYDGRAAARPYRLENDMTSVPVIGNQEIEPAGKKRKAGQQVRPLHTELRTKYDNNNGIIPHAPSPASHQFWGQVPHFFRQRLTYFSNASACFLAASLWPPSIRASSVTRDFLSSNLISEIVRPSFICLVTT